MGKTKLHHIGISKKSMATNSFGCINQIARQSLAFL